MTTTQTSEAETIYEIGASVSCTDGPCGELSRVIVNPVLRSVTHLVVEPHHQHALARLVPVTLAEVRDEEIQLHISLVQLHDLPHAQEIEFLPVDPWMSVGYPADGMLAGAYYAAGPSVVVHEEVPLGEVEICRDERIHAADGVIGRVRGLVVEPAGQQITHVLVHEGHLWGVKDVAIPMGTLDRVDADGVHVALPKHAIAQLPAIALDDPATR